jgi:hypothetical protein
VRSEKYAVMMTTSKSMAPIARRKKPKDGSGITALPLLLAFAIGSEPQVSGLVPKQSWRKSKNAGNAPHCWATERRSRLAIIATSPRENYEKRHGPLLRVERKRESGTNV